MECIIYLLHIAYTESYQAFIQFFYTLTNFTLFTAFNSVFISYSGNIQVFKVSLIMMSALLRMYFRLYSVSKRVLSSLFRFLGKVISHIEQSEPFRSHSGRGQFFCGPKVVYN
uniref:Uncharacterized protein n=1 Tax=Cacopsylla melanoneura TaxID=428564 RepID=A0A8D9BVY8_9HEMI